MKAYKILQIRYGFPVRKLHGEHTEQLLNHPVYSITTLDVFYCQYS